MSIDQRSQFRQGVEGMAASWLWELANHIQHRIPDPVDYIEMRRKVFGSDLTMSLTRITQAGKIPTELLRTRAMRGLESSAQDYACLTNDIFSYQKEIEFEGELHNCVLVLQKFLDIDREQAVSIVNDLMTARVAQFQHIVATELPVLTDEFALDADARKTLEDYVVGMQNWMAGILDWHMLTGRYPETALRRRYRTPARNFGAPTGLGTSAALIDLLSGARTPA
jgi:germacradienol/geosmin synthase